MAARGDLARHRDARLDRQRLGTLHGRRQWISMAQYKSRHAVSQGRLADALCAADQPGMRNPAALVGIEQRGLFLPMPKQHGRLARMGSGNLRLDLTWAHAVVARLWAGAAKKRSRSAVQTLAATAAASPLASIRTQRCGSVAAISR